jgi:hypothetical protein
MQTAVVVLSQLACLATIQSQIRVSHRRELHPRSHGIDNIKIP